MLNATVMLFGLFRHERQRKMSKKPTVKLTLDPNNLPPLTARQHAMLDALEKLPDDEIDCSDIPEHDFSRGARKKIAPKHAVPAHNP